MEYSYRYATSRILFGAAGFLGLGGGIAYIAYTHEGSLELFRLIVYSPETAAVTEQWLALGCVALAVLAVTSIAGGLAKLRIRLTQTDLTGPSRRLFRKASITVPFSQIKGVFIQTIRRVRLLHVHTPKGKITINEADIGEQAFDEIREVLAQRLRTVRG